MAFSARAWLKIGNSQIISNWSSQDHVSGKSIVAQVFKGVCVGFLGLSGVECMPVPQSFVTIHAILPGAPADVPKIRKGRYSAVLRNIHLASVILNGPIMLLVVAVLPLNKVLASSNVLSVLAEEVR